METRNQNQSKGSQTGSQQQSTQQKGQQQNRGQQAKQDPEDSIGRSSSARQGGYSSKSEEQQTKKEHGKTHNQRNVSELEENDADDQMPSRSGTNQSKGKNR